MENDESYRAVEKKIEEARISHATKLDLRWCKLTKLPESLGKLTQLQTLDLSSNHLTELPEWLGKLTQLQTLDLGGNHLTELPGWLGKLTQLQTLDLSSNKLTELPEWLGKLTQLRKLYLGYNHLTELPEWLGKLTQLQTLYLSGSELTELPEWLGKLTQLQTLYLGGNHLTELPEWLGKLTQLQTLNLGGNHLTELPESLGQLRQLQVLYLRSNRLTELPEWLGKLTQLQTVYLGYNPLTELPEWLGKLTQLQTLDLSSNKLTELPEWLGRLTQLQTVYLGGNHLTGLPESLGQLRQLQVLYLRSNRLTELPEWLGKLTQLQRLDLGYNQLTELPESLAQLTQLQSLDLRDNQLSELPPEIVQQTKLLLLDLNNNPLTSPPLEIASKGLNTVKDYFAALSEETLPLNEVKVILVGDGGAGKTCLVKRLLTGEFNPHEPQTHGINIKNWSVTSDKGPTALNIWDFGGQEIMHATHQFFLSERSLYILVLDGRKEEDPEYWLKHVETFGGKSPVLVVLNKLDENPGFDVNRRFLQRKYPAIRGFHRVSCKSGDGFDQLDEAIIHAIDKVDITRTDWPRPWFEVKNALQGMSRAYITYDECKDLCAEHGVNEKSQQETLVAFLHDLGVVVHFSDFHLRDKHVLEPRWLTGAVYRIINADLLAENHGVLSLREISAILGRVSDSLRYPPETHAYIVELMRKFELCYSIDDATILVPDLLEVQEPEFDFDYENSLAFRVDYEFLPRSILPRLIVRQHMAIDGDLRWRTGVVLHDTTFESVAVIKADQAEKRIFVHVSGNHRRDYLTVVRTSINEINRSYEKLSWSERIPMPDDPEVTVGYEHLLRLESQGHIEHYPDGGSHAYNVQELLGAVRFDTKYGEKELLRILRSLIKEEDSEETILKKANEVVMLQPNFMGLGINLNALVKKLIKKKK